MTAADSRTFPGSRPKGAGYGIVPRKLLDIWRTAADDKRITAGDYHLLCALALHAWMKTGSETEPPAGALVNTGAAHIALTLAEIAAKIGLGERACQKRFKKLRTLEFLGFTSMRRMYYVAGMDRGMRDARGTSMRRDQTSYDLPSTAHLATTYDSRLIDSNIGRSSDAKVKNSGAKRQAKAERGERLDAHPTSSERSMNARRPSSLLPSNVVGHTPPEGGIDDSMSANPEYPEDPSSDEDLKWMFPE
jgi:hypothetical protein